MTKSLKMSDFEHWEKFDDFSGSAKTVGKYRIELIGGTNRGAQINIWGSMKMWEEMDLVSCLNESDISDDRKMHKDNEVHFMYFNNAKEEYLNLKTSGDVRFLMQRNG